MFRSTFFGTFGSDAIFSPPYPIDFREIFLNFLERLESTPQVLATDVFVILFVIILVIPLRRADMKDKFKVSHRYSLSLSFSFSPSLSIYISICLISIYLSLSKQIWFFFISNDHNINHNISQPDSYSDTEFMRHFIKKKKRS